MGLLRRGGSFGRAGVAQLIGEHGGDGVVAAAAWRLDVDLLVPLCRTASMRQASHRQSLSMMLAVAPAYSGGGWRSWRLRNLTDVRHGRSGAAGKSNVLRAPAHWQSGRPTRRRRPADGAGAVHHRPAPPFLMRFHF